MSSRAGKAVIAGVCLVALLIAGFGVWSSLRHGTRTEAAAESAAPTRTTAPVAKGDLVESRIFAGTLGHGTAVGLPGAAHGTLTWLPRPGDVIERDQPLYAVDERPVRAMHGAVPLWRTLENGITGNDVAQLNANLAALGYDVVQDNVFGPRTRQAVQRWQKDRGLTVTGAVTADDIAFVDGAVRVASVEGRLGLPADGDVLQLTPTRPVVTASVAPQDAGLLTVGTELSVTINGADDPIPGRVADTMPGRNNNGNDIVEVTVDIEPGDRTLPNTATVQLTATGQIARNVLSVPVSALIAGDAAGEYTVEVVQPDGKVKRVTVAPGFVADGRIAITGKLAEGDEVVVPS